VAQLAAGWPDIMVETFTIVGSLVAFATAAFTLWDRLARARPIAFFGIEGSPSNPLTYIQVKNTSVIDILIIGFRCRPTIFKVSKGSGIKEIANAITDTLGVTIVVPHDAWRFQFLKGPYGSDLKSPVGRIHVWMSWRKSTCTWLPQVPVWLSTTQRDLDRMTGAQ
jgi:hypothetical protein